MLANVLFNNKMFTVKFCAILFCIKAHGITTSTSTPTPPPGPEPARCGYQSCHPVKEGYINVHIVPHTHDDVGWLKTVDQYFYGDFNGIQNAGVQYILDSVMQALRDNKDRRFIYVETAYLWKWWMEQNDFVKHQVQRFVRDGQLEMIGGAWTMNDEATAHYQSIIDQFTWGLRRLNDTFGDCGRPKIGWQIDPFGHSREMASIFAQLGFDGLLLGRIDYQDKQQRFRTKTPEFIWKGSDSLGEKSNLFTGVMYNTYSPPPGFCFDILCSDEPIIDDKHSYAYNVDRRFKQFISYVDEIRRYFVTNNVIITMGGDFTYGDANKWFDSIDRLIRYSNERQQCGSKYNLIYSTPSCYLKAVQDSAKAKNIQWTVKEDDFFPYASDSHSYWTGYFTSRPALKRFERVGNNFLQVCKQLYSLADLGPEDRVDLDAMREAMGVMQHHDAVTGTEKQHVAFDYARLLQNGFDECQRVATASLNVLVNRKKQQSKFKDALPEINFESCLLANISQCQVTEELESFVITVYNPLSRKVNHHVRVPVTGTAYNVYDFNGNLVLTQLMPIAKSILNIPGRVSPATVDLIFIARDIPPLGFLSYYVTKVAGDAVVRPKAKLKSGPPQIRINPSTGKVDQILINDRLIVMNQDFFYYSGVVGNNTMAQARSSGAYIFRPIECSPVRVSDAASYEVYEGKIISEVHQVFNEWTSQIIRGYAYEDFVEFDWLVGPLPEGNASGKEVVIRYSTDLRNNRTFYTDSNGREMLKRVRDYRPTWNVTLNEPVAGNYYPVTSKISMYDEGKNEEFAILTDRAQGGTSLEDGQLELMVHRNCLHDDAFGVEEMLNEKAFGQGLVARGSHYLVAGPHTGSAMVGKSLKAFEKDIAQRKLLAAWTFVSDTNALTFQDYRKQYEMKYSGLINSLPDNVQILTLEPWQANTFLLRLEHVFEKDEDPSLSQPVTVNLKDLFTAFDITSYKETTLGANQWLEDNEKLKQSTGKKYFRYNMSQLDNWLFGTIRSEFQVSSNKIYTVVAPGEEMDEETPAFSVTLEPMQIRTFVIEIVKKASA